MFAFSRDVRLNPLARQSEQGRFNNASRFFRRFKRMNRSLSDPNKRMFRISGSFAIRTPFMAILFSIADFPLKISTFIEAFRPLQELA